MISCTSPSASEYGLPISRVTTRASASLLSSTRRPICWIARPRCGAGVCAHASCAARALRHASAKVPASPSWTSATSSSVLAGLTDRSVPPGAPLLPPGTQLLRVGGIDRPQRPAGRAGGGGTADQRRDGACIRSDRGHPSMLGHGTSSPQRFQLLRGHSQVAQHLVGVLPEQ